MSLRSTSFTFEPNTLNAPKAPKVEAFFDSETSTFTYVLWAEQSKQCAIVDSVLNFDPKAGRTSTTSADAIIDFVIGHELSVQWLLETHAHADHFSAAPYLKQKLGGSIAIGAGICDVQRVFRKVFHLPSDFSSEGAQFDHLFQPDEVFNVGDMRVRAMFVPGHTPADVAYVVEGERAGQRAGELAPLLAFVGDTLFMPDLGSARCDFPGGNASALFHSVAKILALPLQTRLFTCHDYPPAWREPTCTVTVEQQRQSNIHLRDGIDEAQFVQMRAERDATLSMPSLMLPAIQVNIRGGQLPAAEENGISYLKIPINAL